MPVICCYQTSMLLLLGRHVYKNVERQRKERGVKKQPGCMWIEVNNEVCTLVVDDQDHPQMIENPCKTAEIVRAHAQCWVCAFYSICLA